MPVRREFNLFFLSLWVQDLSLEEQLTQMQSKGVFAGSLVHENRFVSKGFLRVFGTRLYSLALSLLPSGHGSVRL